MPLHQWAAGHRVTAQRLRDTSPLQVSAALKMTANQTIANNTPTAISWNGADFDTANGWNAGSPTLWFAPVTGIYDIDCVVPWASNATGRRALTFRVDGIGKVGQAVPVVANVPCTTNASRKLLIPAGKGLSVWLFQTSGAGLDIVWNLDDGPHLDISLYSEA